MYFQILCIGKIKEEFYRRQIDGICTKLQMGQHTVRIIEYPDSPVPERLPENKREAFLEKECARLAGKITARDYVIALCIEGKELSSKEHRRYIEKAAEQEFDTITYVIGGSLGLPEQIKKRANLRMSFSKMTFPHQIMRLVLCEEIQTALYL